jgi:hypothetical protein
VGEVFPTEIAGLPTNRGKPGLCNKHGSFFSGLACRETKGVLPHGGRRRTETEKLETRKQKLETEN